MGGQKDKQVIKNCKIGKNTVIWNFVNLYGCKIGENCMVGTFVEIQKDVEIGDNVRVSSHTFIPSKVKISNDVFIGHGVMFINDLHPQRKDEKYWNEIIVEEGVSIGSNATILPVRIGKNAQIGAGAVVTKDVSPNTIVVGNPATILRKK